MRKSQLSQTNSANSQTHCKNIHLNRQSGLVTKCRCIADLKNKQTIKTGEIQVAKMNCPSPRLNAIFILQLFTSEIWSTKQAFINDSDEILGLIFLQTDINFNFFHLNWSFIGVAVKRSASALKRKQRTWRQRNTYETHKHSRNQREEILNIPHMHIVIKSLPSLFSQSAPFTLSSRQMHSPLPVH